MQAFLFAKSAAAVLRARQLCSLSRQRPAQRGETREHEDAGASQESSTRCRMQFTVDFSSSPHFFTKGKRSFLLLISQKNRLRRAAKAAFCRGAALRGQNQLPPLGLAPPSPQVGWSPPRALEPIARSRTILRVETNRRVPRRRVRPTGAPDQPAGRARPTALWDQLVPLSDRLENQFF